MKIFDKKSLKGGCQVLFSSSASMTRITLKLLLRSVNEYKNSL